MAEPARECAVGEGRIHPEAPHPAAGLLQRTGRAKRLRSACTFTYRFERILTGNLIIKKERVWFLKGMKEVYEEDNHGEHGGVTEGLVARCLGSTGGFGEPRKAPRRAEPHPGSIRLSGKVAGGRCRSFVNVF